MVPDLRRKLLSSSLAHQYLGTAQVVKNKVCLCNLRASILQSVLEQLRAKVE